MPGPSYPFDERTPASGEAIEVATGLHWWRMPMWGPLKHVNGWLLEDGDDLVAVDTGIKGEASTAAWEAILADRFAGRPVARVVCTHFHPDHSGMAGWLCDRFGAALTMTQAEWLTLRLLVADTCDDAPPAVVAFWRGAGWDEAQIAAARAQGWARFATLVAAPPFSYHRIADGDALAIGGRNWRVVTGKGHSPEHACLLDEARGVLIAGDQVLPRISSNVSLGAGEPFGDPLGDWLASLGKLRMLPGDLLVLPGHGEPFHGLHERLDALADEHRDRLDTLAAMLREAPARAVDCFTALFRRPIGPDVLGLATGEALAHLRRLEIEGRATRTISDGIWWWRAA